MTLTGEQIRLRGLAALKKELGRAGLIRFLNHYEANSGDYTVDRPKFNSALTLNALRTRRLNKAKKKTR